MAVKYKSQLKAAKKYIQGKSRFSIWFPKDEKDEIDKLLKKKNVKPRDVFNLGLKSLSKNK